MKTYVYVAGPYSHPDPVLNVRAAMDAAEILWAHGFVPFVPHLSMFSHLVHPQPYETWMERDAEWVRKCDVVLRLPGASSGADQEVEQAMILGITVYSSIGELISAKAYDDAQQQSEPMEAKT